MNALISVENAMEQSMDTVYADPENYPAIPKLRGARWVPFSDSGPDRGSFVYPDGWRAPEINYTKGKE